MTLLDILDGVEQSVFRQWPKAPVYRNRRPKKFERHSFVLEGGPITRKGIGGNQVKVTATVRLTALLPVDAYGNSDDGELLETVDSLMELFEGGYIQVGARCPHVLESTGDYGYDYAEVQASLEFLDISTSHQAPAGDGSLMQTFHTRFEKE